MILKFNSKGHCLINKQTGLRITEKFKDIKYPQRVKSYDIVEIGHNFNPQEFSTKIITFRDKNGEIVQRNIFEKNANEVLQTKKNYRRFSVAQIENPMNPFEMLEIIGRKVSSVIKKNGKYFSKSEEIQTFPKTASNPVVTISKIESSATRFAGVERENQSLYQYRKGEKKGYSLKNIIRNNNGGLFKLGDFDFIFEGIQNLLSDKYLMLHIYPAKHFQRVAPYIVENPLHPVKNVQVRWYNKQPLKDDKTISYGFYDGAINLNNRVVKSKCRVISSTAHEKEHKYQDLQILNSNSGSEEVQKYISASKNYVKAKENLEEYLKNYNEIKAREASRVALDDYFDSLNVLREEFPYAPDYQFGY